MSQTKDSVWWCIQRTICGYSDIFRRSARAPGPPPRLSTTVTMTDGPRSREWIAALAIYLAVSVFVCFFRLGAAGLVMMEGMVADGAQHMLESREWLVPHVYDEVYTYKPALAYWLSSVVPAVAPGTRSEFLLRLPFAVSGFLLGLASLVLIGRELRPRAGLLCAVAMTGGGLFVQKVRMAEYDILITFGVGLATVAACCNLARGRCRIGLWVLAYLALAFGFLAKGAPALMAFVPGLLLAAIASGSTKRLWRAPHLVGVVVLGAIIAAYLVAVYRSAGITAFAQPLEEAQWRGLGWTPAALGIAFVKPLYVAAAFLPWSLLLPRSFGLVRNPEAASSRLLRTAAGFLAGGTATFMLVPTHEMRYYLPLAASAGIVLGVAADDLVDRSAPRWLLNSTLWLATLIAAAGILGMIFVPQGDPLAMLLALGLVGLLLLSTTLRSTGTRVAALLIITTTFAALNESAVFLPIRESKRNLRPIADEMRPLLPSGARVYVMGPADPAGKHSSLLYYLDRPIRAFRSPRDLPLGSYVLLTADQRRVLEPGPGVRFELLKSIRHPWFVYELYRLVPNVGAPARPSQAGGVTPTGAA